MGWTGFPCDIKPANSDLNEFVTRQLEHKYCKVIDRSNWIYREDSEEVGPNAVDCPMSLIPQLQGYKGPDNDWSRQWRQKVYAYHRAGNAN